MKTRSEEGSKDPFKTNIRVFLGYREDSDAHIVERFYSLLIQEGVDVWLDKVSLPRIRKSWVTEWEEVSKSCTAQTSLFLFSRR